MATNDSLEVEISLALAKKRDVLETVVTRAITNALESVNNSIKIQKDLDAHMDVVGGLVSKVDKVQADA